MVSVLRQKNDKHKLITYYKQICYYTHCQIEFIYMINMYCASYFRIYPRFRNFYIMSDAGSVIAALLTIVSNMKQARPTRLCVHTVYAYPFVWTRERFGFVRHMRSQTQNATVRSIDQSLSLKTLYRINSKMKTKIVCKNKWVNIVELNLIFKWKLHSSNPPTDKIK